MIGVLERRPGGLVVAPVEERVDHHRLGHVRRAVVEVRRRRVVEAVGEAGLVPVDRAGHGLGVRIEEELLRRCSGGRPPGPTDRAHGSRTAGRVRRRAGRRASSGRRPRRSSWRTSRAAAVEQAQLDPVGDLAEQAEVRARPVVGRAEGVCPAGPDLGHGGHATGAAPGAPVAGGSGAEGVEVERSARSAQFSSIQESISSDADSNSPSNAVPRLSSLAMASGPSPPDR